MLGLGLGLELGLGLGLGSGLGLVDRLAWLRALLVRRYRGDVWRYVEIHARYRGGIADHLDAGFARAAFHCLAGLTDATWLGLGLG